MEHTTTTILLPADHLVHDSLLQQRRVFLWGQVDEDSSKKIIAQMIYLDALQPGEPINMYINSPGGMVTAGYAIYDTMQAVSSPVYTYCIGFAASMGAILLAGGHRGNRYIYPNAEVMIHQPSTGGFQGNYADIEINARQIVKTRNQSATLLAANCGTSREKILKDFDRDFWMNADEAITYGIVDALVP